MAQASATLLARAYQSLGAKLVVAELDERKCADLRETLGDGAPVSKTDVRNVAEVERLRNQVPERCGKLNVLVNRWRQPLRRRFQRTPEGEWTINPEVVGKAI